MTETQGGEAGTFQLPWGRATSPLGMSALLWHAGETQRLLCLNHSIFWVHLLPQPGQPVPS